MSPGALLFGVEFCNLGLYRSEGRVHKSVLRFLLGIWFLMAFIMGSGYGGNLKQFLINPGLSSPIGQYWTAV